MSRRALVLVVPLLALAAGAALRFAPTLFGEVAPAPAAMMTVLTALLGVAVFAVVLVPGLHWLARAICAVSAVAILGVVLSLLQALASPASEAAHVTAASNPPWSAVRLRVLQQNVLHGYPASDHPGLATRGQRQDDFLEQIERTRPDVVILQEAWCTAEAGCLAEELARSGDFDAAYARANGSLERLGFEEGAAILSRFPILTTEVLELRPARSTFENRIALVARIDHPLGPVEVVSVHLASGDASLAADQARSLEEALRQRGPTPLVIAGDFNARASDDAVTTFASSTYTNPLEEGIDHVLVEVGQWRPLWWKVLPAGSSSDHPATLVELNRNDVAIESRWTGSFVETTSDAAGLNAAQLERAASRISELPGVQGLLVARGDQLVLERYWGAASNRPHNIKSASKSVLSAIAGLAVIDGHLQLDDSLAQHVTGVDPLKSEIRVRDLLTMSSGLESTSFGNYGAWVSSRDWTRWLLQNSMEAPPGSRFRYSTGDTHLLATVLTRAVGEDLLAFANRRLFAPLGIGAVAWQRDPKGVRFGGNNLSMSPRAMLRFGLLYLERGRWGDQQLLPAPWIAATLKPTTNWGQRYGSYGYLWWLRPPSERGAYLASGYGGQYIYVAPADDLVVVVVSTETSKGRTVRRELFDAIREDIVGAVVDPFERRTPQVVALPESPNDTSASSGG